VIEDGKKDLIRNGWIFKYKSEWKLQIIHVYYVEKWKLIFLYSDVPVRYFSGLRFYVTLLIPNMVHISFWKAKSNSVNWLYCEKRQKPKV